ncbi:MAG: tRNA (cytidine(34)-2'-O)-methyltransferase [Gammaproteobacteria bacterium]
MSEDTADPWLHVILYEPEIPPNTGNVMRLCANTGAALHLVHPLGFKLDEKRLRRAGMDYREFARVEEHQSVEAAMTACGGRVFALTTRASQPAASAAFQKGDAVLFGPETRGLPQALLDSLPDERRLRIPMRPESRSLNLSNSVAIMVYEAWRQLGFEGAV